MAFLSDKDIHKAYEEATKEADIWRKDYPEYERLADNGLLSDLDESLPEVNDGSLSAALFKLPKRIVSTKLRGRAKALNCEDDWKTELATMQWERDIVPHANTQAPFHRKWKDAVRKAAVYGGQPIVTLFVENGSYTGSDFIVPYVTDVKLEAGKVSDYDSDIIFWDVYYSKSQVQDMIDEAKEDAKSDPKTKQPVKDTGDGDKDETDSTVDDGYNKWNIGKLQELVDSDEQDSRSGNEEASQKQEKGVKKSGIHFYIAFQRGVNAPYKMLHKASKTVVREWSNPDPTGDLAVHYIYCYQDFINPYGTGICKLAGGTQNVLDYMRQADVLATQLGLRPPKLISGDDSQVDYDSLTYTEDADWIIGPGAKLERMEMANGVYSELPNRIQMYKSSLNQLIPTGDTSVGAEAGDPQQSKTPAGVKLQAQNLSIDDQDFKDNFYMTYAAVARSMINTHFANMQGNDMIHLDSDERDLLQKNGIDFPINADGTPSSKLNVEWEKTRGTFDFIVDPSSDMFTDDQQQIAVLKDILAEVNPQTQWMIGQDGYKFNAGEAYYNLFKLMNLENFSKIMPKMTSEEAQQAKQQPFPIIDKPQVRVNTADLTAEQIVAVLAEAGVNLPQAQPGMQPQSNMPAGLSPQGQADFIVEMAKAQGAQAETPAAPQGADPNELALKQQDLQIKQQQTDQKAAELTLKAHAQGHQQGLDELKLLQAQQSQQHSQQMAEKAAQQQAQQAKSPVGSAK